jgi:hypothetical protein
MESEQSNVGLRFLKNKGTNLIQNQNLKSYFGSTVAPCYNDIGLYDTSPVASDIL